MTSVCACKRGIFVLRPCGEVSSSFCTRCGRPACPEHLAAGTQPPVCVECRARAEEAAALGGADRAPAPETAAAYRHRFYRSSGYRPFLAGGPDAYYDEYDVRPFDPELAAGVEADEDREGGFFDS